MTSRLLITLVLTALLMACQSSNQGGASGQEIASSAEQLSATGGKINWRVWSDSLPNTLSGNDRLLFLYLTTFWCVPCHEMESEVLENDSIAEILNQRFVPIRVDGDRFPNLAERYNPSGYPSCLVLTPDFRLLGGAMRVPVDSLKVLLGRVLDMWTYTPAVAEIQSARLDSVFRAIISERKPQRPSDKLLAYTEQALYHYYDSTYGGVGNQPKAPVPDVNQFMFNATAPNGALLFKGEITQTLQAQLKLLDPVWGGFYRIARFADWSGISHEKLLTDNARILIDYIEAYQASNEMQYRDASESILSYLDQFLRTEHGWGFYNSQAGIVATEQGDIDPEEYFAKGDGERRAIGFPEIDKSILAAPNLTAVVAYFRAGRVLNRPELSEYARVTLDSILLNGVGVNGLVRRDLSSKMGGGELLLEDQVSLLSALIDAYETTGKKVYFERAVESGRAIYSHFRDPDGGGLTIDLPAEDAVGRMTAKLKPYGVNAYAVTNFVRLFYHMASDEFKKPAEETFYYLMSIPIRNNDMRLCMLSNAYLNITRYPLKLVLIGPRGDEYYNLLGAVWAESFPRLIIKQLGEGESDAEYGKLRFAATERPKLFACGEDTLSRPIESPDSVSAVVREFQVALLRQR